MITWSKFERKVLEDVLGQLGHPVPDRKLESGDPESTGKSEKKFPVFVSLCADFFIGNVYYLYSYK